MRYKKMRRSGVEVSAVTVGTWAIGGANSLGGNYGEIDDAESVRAIRAMVDGGVNLIDTAPIYGEGHAEEVVRKAVSEIGRDKVLIATKFGSYIKGGKGVHCSSPESVRREFEASRRRLGTDYFDIYLMHWPDTTGTPIEETMGVLADLKDQGKIRMVGLCNSDQALMERANATLPLDMVQLPFSMVNMSAVPQMRWCEAHGIDVMTWGSLGSGILTGKIREMPRFDKDDFRLTFYPFYKEPLFSKIMALLGSMDKVSAKYGKPLAQIAINWNAQKSFVTTSLTGVRNEDEARINRATFDWKLEDEDIKFLDGELSRLGITEAVS